MIETKCEDEKNQVGVEKSEPKVRKVDENTVGRRTVDIGGAALKILNPDGTGLKARGRWVDTTAKEKLEDPTLLASSRWISDEKINGTE